VSYVGCLARTSENAEPIRQVSVPARAAIEPIPLFEVLARRIITGVDEIVAIPAIEDVLAWAPAV
jgi:hypothetical protein